MHWKRVTSTREKINSIQFGGCCAPTKKILCCCCCCNTVGVPGSDETTEACVASIGRAGSVPATGCVTAALCCPAAPAAARDRSTAACRYAPRDPNSSLYSESMSGGVLLALGVNTIGTFWLEIRPQKLLEFGFKLISLRRMFRIYSYQKKQNQN